MDRNLKFINACYKSIWFDNLKLFDVANERAKEAGAFSVGEVFRDLLVPVADAMAGIRRSGLRYKDVTLKITFKPKAAARKRKDVTRISA